MAEEKKELSSYQKYVQRRNEEMHNPKPPSEKEYVRLNEKGRTEYMKFVRKAYEMMFFWIGFGGLMGYLSYTLAPQVRFLRNRPSFKRIRLALTLLPIGVFSYHGTKFMLYYKRRGAREVGRDESNHMSEEEYLRQVEAQSAVREAAE
jgi:hypothetical protein